MSAHPVRVYYLIGASLEGVAMDFRLVFRGELPSGNSKTLTDVHRVRCAFHKQLQELWKTHPALDAQHLDEVRPKGDISVLEKRAGHSFVCVVTNRLFLHCELQILFLRPHPKGEIVTQSGDLDNRIKTLFDALRIPTEKEANSLFRESTALESPFHCLLQDDALISKFSVDADRLLEFTNPREVHLVITANVRPTKTVWGNLGY